MENNVLEALLLTHFLSAHDNFLFCSGNEREAKLFDTIKI